MIAYTVGIPDAATHRIDVCLTISQPDPIGQQLRLPNWIPGSYMIREFSRNIVAISATDSAGPVTLRKLDKSTWQAPAGLDLLVVNYQVYAWDLSVRAAHVDRTHAFFNGTSIFLAVRGQEDEPHQVIFERPSHDVGASFEIATALTAVAIDFAGFGLYQTVNYDELIDHPVEQGTFKRLRFAACGVPHELVLTGACHFDEDRVLRDLTRICEYQIKLFGEPAPMDKYVFMAMVTDAGYGGLEHRASTALMISRESLPVIGQDSISDDYLQFLGLCSHEYFHTWNIKRIKPARFIPYELHSESHTELLWFFEGVTSYYDDLVLARVGLIDQERYLGLLAKTLTRVHRGQGRLMQTVTESSFDAWHKFYKQDENAPNAIVSYYTKGALVALCLDALMRKQTDGAATLDTLMRSLWARWMKSQAGVAEQEPQQLASEITGRDLSEFFDSALYSTVELPVYDALYCLGIRLKWRVQLSSSDMGSVAATENPKPLECTEASTEESVEGRFGNTDSTACSPWLGATVIDAPGGVKVTQVLTGSPAERAGLAAGDILVAMNRLSLSKTDVENHLQRYADLSKIPVHYFRLGQLHETLLPLESGPADTAELQIVDSALVTPWLQDVQAHEDVQADA